METLKRLLFETPLAFYIILVLGEAAVAAIWHTRRTRRWTRALLIVPVLAVIIGLTSYLVETDKEKINSAMADIARSVESGDLNAAVVHLDPSCLAPAPFGKSLDKDELIRIGRMALHRRPVKRLTTVGPKTKITDDKATTEVKARIILESSESVDTYWRLEWARGDDGWRIVVVEALYPPELASWDF
ncbi:MAG: hypothetical protein SVV80_08455 [Planctomycetota bacterium]|nr:hypothetical protein [Planctomycetota bacterium]